MTSGLQEHFSSTRSPAGLSVGREEVNKRHDERARPSLSARPGLTIGLLQVSRAFSLHRSVAGETAAWPAARAWGSQAFAARLEALGSRHLPPSALTAVRFCA